MRQPLFRRHPHHELPQLNVASLPDLIFTVLFFFMIVTHMRQVEQRVQVSVPQGTELQKPAHKSAVVPVYVGTDGEGQVRVQVGQQLVPLSQVGDYVAAERSRMTPEDAQHLVVSLHADRHTPMGVIADVKRQLQQAYALRISYAATSLGSQDE